MQPKISLKHKASESDKRSATELDILDIGKNNKILCVPVVYYL